jgi:hypothetical protein
MNIYARLGLSITAAIQGGVRRRGRRDLLHPPVIVGGVVRTVTPTTFIAGDAVRHTMTTGGNQVTMPYTVPESGWSYAAAAGGILNTTVAVTVKAAAGAGLRNYITNVQVMAEALGAATEVAIRDGAAGTVIWRIKVPTGGLPAAQFDFAVPLKGTAATLLEVVTLTASVTGAVYVNLQGFVAP